MMPLPCCAAISIHAPRGGSDEALAKGAQLDHIFQSTLPVGGATASGRKFHFLLLFQSTLPVGGAT